MCWISSHLSRISGVVDIIVLTACCTCFAFIRHSKLDCVPKIAARGSIKGTELKAGPYQKFFFKIA